MYVHIFPNMKLYVGITSTKPEYRWANGKGYSSQSYMRYAIQKYGWENVEHVIVYQTRSRQSAFEMEKYLIFQFKTNQREFGYNLSSGGESGAVGVLWSEERKRRYSEQSSGPLNHNYGRKMSAEQRRRISDAAKKRPPRTADSNQHIRDVMTEMRGVAVVCYETGQLFLSESEAARWANASSSNIVQAMQGFPKRTCRGYHWVRSTEYRECQTLPRVHAPKPVICVETGIRYPSIGEAARCLGLDQRHISRCCRFPTRMLKGCHWKYADV